MASLRELAAQHRRIEQNNLRINLAFADALRDMRLDAGLSQREMGEPMGISAQGYARLERGESRICMAQFYIACWTAGVSPAEVFERVMAAAA